jgi:hypothetical protein
VEPGQACDTVVDLDHPVAALPGTPASRPTPIAPPASPASPGLLQRLRGDRGNRTRAFASLAPGLEHQIIVPRGPGGRPGERLMAPSLSIHPPKTAKNGVRTDFRVFLSRAGSTFCVMSIGPVARCGGAEQNAHGTVAKMRSQGQTYCSDPAPTTVLGAPAWQYRAQFNGSRALIESKFERGGWLWVAGILTSPHGDNEAALHATVRAIFATWTWI